MFARKHLTAWFVACVAAGCSPESVSMGTAPQRATTIMPDCTKTPAAAGCAAAGRPAGNVMLVMPPAGSSATGLAGSGASAGMPALPMQTRPMTGPAGAPAIMPAAGSGGAGMRAPATAGAPATPPAAGGGATGENLAGVSAAELEMLRQTCVDEINMYRATLTAMNLKPLKRATADQEACSDKGAQMDGDSGMAHGSARAGLCRSVGLGAENTCPGWGVGPRTGNNTLADALKGCLKAMWAEGEPPVSRAECTQDINGCFQDHGHYLNMSGTAAAVACSFYKMKSGQYWMNQDFSGR
jgi:hypothetical protein